MSHNISCTGEVYITRKANHSPAFLLDLHLEKLAVSLGKDQTEAIEELQKCEIRRRIRSLFGSYSSGKLSNIPN